MKPSISICLKRIDDGWMDGQTDRPIGIGKKSIMCIVTKVLYLGLGKSSVSQSVTRKHQAVRN